MNAIVPIKLFEKRGRLTSAQLVRIDTVSSQEKLNSRSSLKILRLGRIVSDVIGEDAVSDAAVDEALKWKTQASRDHGSLIR